MEDEEEQLVGGLSLFDKGVLGFIWGISFIYGALTEQVISKKINIPCSVRDPVSDSYSIASILLAIIFPMFIGPLIVTIIHVVISIINVVMKNAPIAADLRNEELQNIFCILLLTIIFFSTYITSMVICELLYPDNYNILTFIVIKFIIGTSHHLLGPLSILLSRRDILVSAVSVYKKGGTTQAKDLEITAEQIRRELGLGVQT